MIARHEPLMGPQDVANDPPERERTLTLTADPGEPPAPPEGPARTAAARPPRPAPPRPGSMIKHYEILRDLGRGGMGTVFVARDVKLDRLVALKLVIEGGERAAEILLSEARAMVRCAHESIAVIHDVDDVSGTPFMVLEYVEGPTLRALMPPREGAGAPGPGAPRAAPAAVPPARALEIMIPVVRALACAHRHGVVHRDLKPENILVPPGGAIKVLDFGVALQRDAGAAPASITAAPPRAPRLAGTRPYMAPEQLRGEDVDARCDLWAAGVILYELVAGAHPLAPFSPGWIDRVKDLDAPMPRARDLRPDLGALVGVIDHCLEKRRARRVGSAEALLDALESITARIAGRSRRP